MNKPAVALFSSIVLFGVLNVQAATVALNSAKVTETYEDVRLEEEKKQRAAVVGDLIEGAKSLYTGKKSRAELVFNDNTVARLGANSIFSFKPASRDMRLSSGFLLLQTPQGKGGAVISTPSASAAVLGTTIMLSASSGGVEYRRSGRSSCGIPGPSPTGSSTGRGGWFR